jgi:hypothetical protein
VHKQKRTNDPLSLRERVREKDYKISIFLSLIPAFSFMPFRVQREKGKTLSFPFQN